MMKLRNGQLLTIACLIVATTGCQTGKLNMSSLAFWKKDSTLSSEFIEPPSHQYTPGESAFAQSDDNDLPPLPPDVDKTLDSYERDVSNSYEELAKQTQKSRDRFAEQVRQLEVDTRNVSAPPGGISSTDFSSPFTPKPTNNQIARNTNNNSRPSRTPYSPTDNSAPATSRSNSGMTNYEQIAQTTLPVPGNSSARPDSGSFVPMGNTSPNRMASTPNPLIPAQSGSQRSRSYTQSPASASASQSSTFTPNAAPLTPRSNDSEQVNYEYPSTPYQPFQPRTGTSGHSNQGATAGNQNGLTPSSTYQQTPANTGMSLDIQGQGSYAPGSVRALAPLNPAQLTLPMRGNSSGPENGNGSFQPR